MHLIKRKTLNAFLGAVTALSLLASCSAEKNVIYLQDLTPDGAVTSAQVKEITVEPGDEIMVFVSCDDMEVSQKLSLVAGSRRQDFVGGATNYNNSVTVPYLVDNKGNINMPILGDVHVAGLTRKQISELVTADIIKAKLAKEGTVNVSVQFANLYFATLGEVANHGRFAISQDHLTILDAIAMAGDLTIHGRRDRVWVIREESDGSRKSYLLDLRDSKFMESPAYFVEQNDVIYVEPNTVRAGQSTINENTFKSVGFWTSLVSVAISITTLIVTLTRK